MAIDLSNLLKPVTVRTSFLKTVRVDVRTQAFSDWFRKGWDHGRWANSYDLVRAILVEQSRDALTGEALGVEKIDGLTPRQLNAFAKSLISAADRLVVPHLIADGPGNRLRERRKGEGYPAEKRAGESESARLLRLLTDRNEEQRAQARQLADDMRKMLEGPADLLRRIDPFGDQINKLRRETLGNSLFGQLATLRDSLSIRSQLEAEARFSAGAISRAIESAAFGRSLHASAIQQYGMIRSQMADQQSAISRAKDVLQFAIGQHGAADGFMREEMARQRDWGLSVRHFLNPSLSSGLLASLVGGQHNLAVSGAIEAAASLSRGFTTAANLGLAGAGARGAVAEILGQYRGDPTFHSDVFRDVMNGIQLVDEDELVDEKLADGLRRARHNSRRIDLTDPVQIQIFLTLIAILIGSYQVVLQQEAIELSKSSATSAEVLAVRNEARGLRDDLRRAREEDRHNQRDIRYVVDATPLRLEPNGHSMVLLTVYPDQLLRVQDTRGAWVRVEVVPYSGATTQSGWISRRRLRISPSN